MSHFKAKMHQVQFPFVRPFFLTQSTSCSDRCRLGMTVEISVDVVAVLICTSPSVCSWSLTIYKCKRRTTKPSSLGSKKTSVSVLHDSDKNRGFRFGFGNCHSTRTHTHMHTHIHVHFVYMNAKR